MMQAAHRNLFFLRRSFSVRTVSLFQYVISHTGGGSRISIHTYDQAKSFVPLGTELIFDQIIFCRQCCKEMIFEVFSCC